MPVIQRSALLKATLLTVLLLGTGLGAAAAAAQPPDVPGDRAQAPGSEPSGAASSESGYHDLICKPNGTEDGFDCADTATPAKIVPIPSQVQWPRGRYEAVSG